MYAFYGVAMALIVGAFLLIHWYRDVRELRWGAIVLVGALTAIGGLVQFRERCPRCAIRIGRHARLILPEKCPECGVAFPRRADVPAPR